MFDPFLDALGFLTRLGPARVMTDDAMRRCTGYMPAVGMALGLVVILPFALGLFGNAPWVQAWLMTALAIYLTRGLHHDGVADICDAVTTHGAPERFWEVVKDSRSGAFGVLGLVMVVGGQVILLHEMAEARAFLAIAWCFVLGRTACVGFAYTVSHLGRPGLGRLTIGGATLPMVMGWTAATFVLGWIMAGFGAAVAGMFFSALALYALHELAQHVRGVNGDFLGTAILLGELGAGLGVVLFG